MTDRKTKAAALFAIVIGCAMFWFAVGYIIVNHGG